MSEIEKERRERLQKMIVDMSMVPPTIAAWSDQVRLCMLECGITNERVADRFEVATSTVAQWKSGAAAPMITAHKFVLAYLQAKLIDERNKIDEKE
jgi:DNA-binding transcriptional regulator YiaG